MSSYRNDPNWRSLDDAEYELDKAARKSGLSDHERRDLEAAASDAYALKRKIEEGHIPPLSSYQRSDLSNIEDRLSDAGSPYWIDVSDARKRMGGAR